MEICPKCGGFCAERNHNAPGLLKCYANDCGFEESPVKEGMSGYEVFFKNGGSEFVIALNSEDATILAQAKRIYKDMPYEVEGEPKVWKLRKE